MYSDVVDQTIQTTINDNAVYAVSQDAVYEHWKDWKPSEISHHGKLCCDIAREWITAKDFSELSGSSRFTGPRWLRQMFKWGASSFPIYWCEAVTKKTLDCGALAALAFEVLTARGILAFRAQMIQRFSEASTVQWCNSWSDGLALPWTKGDLIYHEGCAIAVKGNRIKVWDASAGWWVDPKASDGYGGLLAIKISGWNIQDVHYFEWGQNVLAAHGWTQLAG